MRVSTLTTEKFRNLQQAEISFAPGVNLFTGENGQGKTNLLEAVFLFKFGRSFRTHRDAEMICFGEPFCRVETTGVFDDAHRESFSATVERGGAKRVKINGEPVGKLSDLVGRFPVVLFGPHDLRMITGQPAERRRFIDMVGSMTDASYLRLLREYRRVLNQRNAALKSRASVHEREVWNGELVARGCALVQKRLALTAVLEEHLAAHTSGLDAPFEFSLAYDSTVLRESRLAAGGDENAALAGMQSVFETKLITLEHEELRRGTTLAGPHRDDVSIELSGNDVRKFGSQGQRRLLAILLKLAELSYLESELRERCVLLLDDVFSEFDREITAKLQRLLEGDRQVFVTSPVPLDWARSHDVRVFDVQDGRVTPAQ